MNWEMKARGHVFVYAFESICWLLMSSSPSLLDENVNDVRVKVGG